MNTNSFTPAEQTMLDTAQAALKNLEKSLAKRRFASIESATFCGVNLGIVTAAQAALDRAG